MTPTMMKMRLPDAMDMPMLLFAKPVQPRFRPEMTLTPNAARSLRSFPPNTRCPPVYHRYPIYADAKPEMIQASFRIPHALPPPNKNVMGGTPPANNATDAITNRASDQRKLLRSSWAGCEKLEIFISRSKAWPGIRQVEKAAPGAAVSVFRCVVHTDPAGFQELPVQSSELANARQRAAPLLRGLSADIERRDELQDGNAILGSAYRAKDAEPV